MQSEFVKNENYISLKAKCKLDNRTRNFYTSGCAKCKFHLIAIKRKEEKLHEKTMQTIERRSC